MRKVNKNIVSLVFSITTLSLIQAHSANAVGRLASFFRTSRSGQKSLVRSVPLDPTSLQNIRLVTSRSGYVDSSNNNGVFVSKVKTGDDPRRSPYKVNFSLTSSHNLEANNDFLDGLIPEAKVRIANRHIFNTLEYQELLSLTIGEHHNIIDKNTGRPLGYAIKRINSKDFRLSSYSRLRDHGYDTSEDRITRILNETKL